MENNNAYNFKDKVKSNNRFELEYYRQFKKALIGTFDNSCNDSKQNLDEAYLAWKERQKEYLYMYACFLKKQGLSPFDDILEVGRGDDAVGNILSTEGYSFTELTPYHHLFDNSSCETISGFLGIEKGRCGIASYNTFRDISDIIASDIRTVITNIPIYDVALTVMLNLGANPNMKDVYIGMYASKKDCDLGDKNRRLNFIASKVYCESTLEDHKEVIDDCHMRVLKISPKRHY